MRNDFPAGRCRFGHAKHESGCAVFFRNSPDDRPASVADIVVEELRKKEINGPIRLPKRDFFTRGQKLKVKDPWHILSGYDLEFAGMSTRERVRVMLEWFGRRQTIALLINSVVGCLIATILLMISSENNVRTPWPHFGRQPTGYEVLCNTA